MYAKIFMELLKERYGRLYKYFLKPEELYKFNIDYKRKNVLQIKTNYYIG